MKFRSIVSPRIRVPYIMVKDGETWHFLLTLKTLRKAMITADASISYHASSEDVIRPRLKAPTSGIRVKDVETLAADPSYFIFIGIPAARK
jgi:hypothetical protein